MTQVNMMGKAFVGLTLPMLLTSTVLIGLVLLVESVLRRWVRAGLRYWLVTCVLAYLVLIPLLSFNPPSTHWPTGGGSLIASVARASSPCDLDPGQVPAAVTSPQRGSRGGTPSPRDIGEPQAAYTAEGPNATDGVGQPDPTSSTPARHTHAPLPQPTTGQSGVPHVTDHAPDPSQTTLGGVGERPRTLSWQGAIFMLWLIGAVVIGGVLTGRALAACRRLDTVPAANNLMNDILLYCRRRMGVHGTVTLKVGPAGIRPAVCGLLRPVIIVPRNLAPTLGSRHLRDVLFHELAHIKRHDLWVNLAQNVLQVLYFYNPLILVVNAAIRRLRDEAADEAVLKTIGDPDHLYTRRLTDVETITIKDPPPSLHLIGVA